MEEKIKKYFSIDELCYSNTAVKNKKKNIIWNEKKHIILNEK